MDRESEKKTEGKDESPRAEYRRSMMFGDEHRLGGKRTTFEENSSRREGEQRAMHEFSKQGW